MNLKIQPFFRKFLGKRNAINILFFVVLIASLFVGVKILAQNGWVRVGNGGQVPGVDLKESPDSASLSGSFSCSNGGSVHINYVIDWNSEMCPNWEPTMQKFEFALGGNNHIESWWHTYTKYTFNDYLITQEPTRSWCAGYITPGEFVYDESACDDNGGGGGNYCDLYPSECYGGGNNGGGGYQCYDTYRVEETCVTIDGDTECDYEWEYTGRTCYFYY